MRFIAASLVLFGHSYPIASLTQVDWFARSFFETSAPHFAVDIFFIASGFLVTASLLARKDVASFCISRFVRIFPALTVATFLTAFVLGPWFTTLPLQEYLHHPDTWRHWWVNSFPFTYVYVGLPGVFENNPIANSVNGSLWTLPWEIKMYGVLALLGLLTYSRFSLLHEKGMERVILLIWLVGLAGLCLFAYRPPFGEIWGQHSDLYRFVVCFFSGSLFFIHRRKIPLNHFVLMVVILLIVTERLIVGNEGRHHNLYYPLRSVLTAYLVLYFAYIPTGKIKGFNRFGDYSYGIYIYAFPIQQAIAASVPGINPLPLFFLAMPATLLLSMLSWHCLENPLLQHKDHLTRLVAPVARWLFPPGAARN